MSDIRVTRFGQFLKRLTANFGAQQGGTLVDDIMPVGPVYDVQGAEFAWMRDEGIGAVYETVSALAANFSSLAISNDSADGLLVLQELQVIGGGTSFVDVQKGSPVAALGMAASAVIPILTDTRWANPAAAPRDPPARAKTARIYTRQNAIAGVVTQRMTIPAGLNWELPFPVVLGPGWFLLVEGSVVNQAVQVNFQFTERQPVDAGELR